MEKIKYIVYFTYQINDYRERHYSESFDEILTKEEYKNSIQKMYSEDIVIISVDKIEKEITITEEINID